MQISGGHSIQSQRHVVEPGAVETRPEHAAPAAHDRERQERPVDEEVVLETGGHRIVDLGDLVSEFFQQRRRLQRQLAHLRAGFSQNGFGADRDPQPLRARLGDVADRGELRVAVGPLGLSQERRGVAHRARHHPVGDEVKRHPGGLLVQRQPPARRLQTDKAVARRGNSDRPAAVVGVRDRHHTGRDECRRAR